MMIILIMILLPLSYIQKKGSVTQKLKIGDDEVCRAGITKLERYKNGIPVFGSLADPRMGTNSAGIRCKTCDCTYAGSGSRMDDCPGHFGHIELYKPVYHCGFIDEVVRILRCVCFSCSRLLLDENVPKDRECLKINDPETRFRKIHDRCNRTSIKCESVEMLDVVTNFLDEIELGANKSLNGHNNNNHLNIMTDHVKKNTLELINLMGGIDSKITSNTLNKLNNNINHYNNGHLNNNNTITDHNSITNSNITKKIDCRPPCGSIMPKFRRDGMTVYITYPDDMENIPGTGQKKQELSASKVYEIFRRITDDDVIKIGLDPKWSRPEWMLVTILPVPPPHVRPTVMEGDIQSEDDLTFQLTNIVKQNLILESSYQRGDPQHIKADFEKLLQTRVTSFFDNERDDSPRETQKTGRPLKTLRQRLRGKEGRLRGNLMGKRVDFSARTVITADPNLSIDQVRKILMYCMMMVLM